MSMGMYDMCVLMPSCHQSPEAEIRSPRAAVIGVSCLAWVLKSKLGFSAIAASVLNHSAISLALA